MADSEFMAGASKSLPLNVGLSKQLQGKTVPMANEKSAYSPMIGGVANGRPLTCDGRKGGATRPNVMDDAPLGRSK